ncbi:MAG: phosphoribosyltransferase family protein [Roseomonas sp.]|nr:phosphoribosyltransferase family protein [Roseomonas sp.]
MLAVRVAALRLRDPVVYALPRSGVPVAAEVADALHAPLDLVLVRKIGAPGQPELALGAVVDGAAPEMVLNPAIVAATGATDDFIAAARQRELVEIERRRLRYLAGRSPIDPAGRDVVVVDDGIATGATARAALHALRRRGAARLVLATPVAPAETPRALRAEADEIICLLEPSPFYGVGLFYRDFHQLTDDEVIGLLAARSHPHMPGGGTM